jgi:pimeloyl-ACP methyl ester carboxylesterase
MAERLWFTPPRPPASVLARHAAVLSSAEALRLRVDGRDLHGWTLGEGPLALLVHGWGGWAAQFGPIAQALASAGFQAVSVDLPGHGQDRARRSDLFQMSDALHALVAERRAPALIVAHSLGAMAASYAFDDTPPPAAAFLAPALSTDAAIEQFIHMMRLRPDTAQDLRLRLRTFIGDAWPLVNQGAELEWPRGPLLVIHDRHDPQTPFTISAALADRHAHVDLMEVDGPGHNRVLREPAVIEAVADFALAHVASSA